MNCGSADSFQVCTTCGLRPNARQIRDTADWDMPADRAIDRDRLLRAQGDRRPYCLREHVPRC
jgi:hypothetical protein